jgi:GDP-L-fucose synthase
MNKGDKVYIAGHNGMVGSALVRKFRTENFSNIIVRDRKELDLSNQAAVNAFFRAEKPDVVVLAAAKVGGIHANNTYGADFIYQNLIIVVNVVEAAYRNGVERLLFLGSSCVYPKEASQPLREECLLSGPLERTNEPYAIAKIAGLKLCQSYRRQYGSLYHSVMPTNLYGSGDNYHPGNSHVLPALVARIHAAKVKESPEVVVWGSGSPKREFLHVDDMADACYFLLQNENPPDLLNVGSGVDLSIRELAYQIKNIVGYEGELTFDSLKPDGTLRKLLDVSKMRALGWEASIDLSEGLRRTYASFLDESERGDLRLV